MFLHGIKTKLINLNEDIVSYLDGGDEARAQDHMLGSFSREIENIIYLINTSEGFILENE